MLRIPKIIIGSNSLLLVGNDLAQLLRIMSEIYQIIMTNPIFTKYEELVKKL
jgi:hypothetical protein